MRKTRSHEEVKDESTKKYNNPAIKPLEALTDNQRVSQKYFNELRQLVLLTGAAGVGKSFLAAHQAAVLLQTGKIDRIVLVRPMVSTANSLAALPGTVHEKLYPALTPIISHLTKFLGKGVVDCAFKNGKIELMPMEFLRGASFDYTCVIAEEIQNCSVDEVKSLVTRLGEGSFLFITGDPVQRDIKNQESGIVWLERLVNKYSDAKYLDKETSQELSSNVGIVRFTNNDVVRSGLCKAFVKSFNKEEGSH